MWWHCAGSHLFICIIIIFRGFVKHFLLFFTNIYIIAYSLRAVEMKVCAGIAAANLKFQHCKSRDVCGLTATSAHDGNSRRGNDCGRDSSRRDNKRLTRPLFKLGVIRFLFFVFRAALMTQAFY